MTDKTFNDFTFEVIDVSITGTPDMHITQNGITFTRKLLEDMEYPQYVTPMVDFKKEAFALKACKCDAKHAIRFSKSQDEQKSALKTSSTAIRQILRGLMGDKWMMKNRYYITGVWDAKENAMVFELNAAKELPPFNVQKLNPVKKRK